MTASPIEQRSGVVERNIPVQGKKRWWLNWEVYLIVAIALSLRLLFINTTQFMADHAIFYQMANDGLRHSLWPISGNRASTGPLISPLFVYLMMLPAAISPNPIGGAIFIALCNTAGVLITYLFTRRYYGRLAGTIASLLYATAINVILFNRDIWQPDLLPPLAVLFMWCLFRGTVELRRNWFFPAVLLLSAMCQLHSSAVYLIIPLCTALILAFKTLRIGEVVMTAGALLIFSSPYLLLEIFNGFADINQYIQLAKLPVTFNTESLQFYALFIRSTVYKPWRVNSNQAGDTHIFQANNHSIMFTTPLHYLQFFLQIENTVMPYLLICAILACVFMMVRPGKEVSARGGSKRSVVLLWKGFLASPERKGLLLLLLWQSIVLLMMRDSIDLFIHYLLFFVPGQFILLAIFLARLPVLLGHFNPSWEKVARYSIIFLSTLIIFAQFIGSSSTLIDRAQGNFDSRSVSPEYFDLASLQNILDSADQLAQERHISRIYMPTDLATTGMVQYLAQFEKTSIVTFNDDQCMVLPSAQAGPVVFIAPPHSPEVETILNNYADTIPAGTVAHTGGAPFQLYILTAKPEPAPALQFTEGWQALSANAWVLSNTNTGGRWLTTRWSAPTTWPPAPRTIYNYSLQLQLRSTTLTINCLTTSMYMNDQFFLLRGLNKAIASSQYVIVRPSFILMKPATYQWGPFTFVTYDEVDTSDTPLQATNGEKQIIMDITTSR